MPRAPVSPDSWRDDTVIPCSLWSGPTAYEACSHQGGVSDQHALPKRQSTVFTIPCRSTFARRLLLAVLHLGRPCGGLCRLMRMLCGERELPGLCNRCSSCELPWVLVLLRAVDVPALLPCSCTASVAPSSGIDLRTSLSCAVACLPPLASLLRACSVACELSLVLPDAICCTADVSAWLLLCTFCCGWPAAALLPLLGVRTLLNLPSRECPKGKSDAACCACL